MQAMFKCFEFFPSEGGSLATRKIAFKIKAGENDFASQDTSAFLDYLGELMGVSEEALKSTLDQFEWVPLEGDGELPAEVIDLTGMEAMPHSLMTMLLGGEEAENDAEALPDKSRETPETDVPDDVLNDLGGNLPGLEPWGGDPLEETETDPQATAITDPDNSVAQLETQQSEVTDSASGTAIQNKNSDEPAENLPNKSQEEPFAFSYSEKSKFKLKFFTEKNTQTEDQQTTRSQNSFEGTETDETAELQPVTKGLSSDLKTRAGETQATATKIPPESGDTKETADVQRNTSGSSLEPSTRADQASKAIPEVSPKAMEAVKHAEAHRNPNSPSLTPASALEQTEHASLPTSKGDDNQVVNSADINDVNQSHSQQHAFKNETGTTGQHQQQQSGFTFRESFHNIETHMNANFKEVAAAPESENMQAAVQDKTLQQDVMRQIVQRMSLRSDRLQSQMNIKLKPEFLGDLRLQISTANQHVTIKMTAESASVKEMIEANIAVLRSELQQHGLQIDKFDVFVGQESDAWKQREQQTASRQERRNKSFRSIQDGEDEDESATRITPFMRNDSRRLRQNDAAEIDFFA